MAQRKSTTRFNSEVVQGEGSFVVVRKLTMGDVKQLRKQTGKDITDDVSLEIGVDTIAAHIIEWNWVDDNDKPLPIPNDDPAIIDKLTTDEFKFLAESLTGGEAIKNLDGGSKPI